VTETPPARTPPLCPQGLHNAFLFAAFNPLSFQIVLGSPMILYAKSLGASATILGLMVGMMPLLVIFQIPAASYIDRIGYRRFVLAGWSTRVMFIFGMAFVPLTDGFLAAGHRLALLLGLLFCFNLVRGISSSAWLPWISALVPETVRGRYLVRDVAVQNLASLAVFLLSAVVLAGRTHAGQYSALFAFSAVMGACSLIFLKRIPDVEIAAPARVSREPVPWREMLRHPPFRQLLCVSVAWSIAYGGVTAFTVSCLKSKVGMPEGEILLVTSVAFAGGLSSLWFLGHRLDHLGSKPVLGFSIGLWMAIMAGWVALAGGALAASLPLVLALQFLMGLSAALVNMANNRLAMAIVPPLGRNHFFAIYSVFGNVSLGLAPIGWGLLIDAVGERQGEFLGLVWNRYAVFFAATTVAFAVTLAVTRRLVEPKAASMEKLLAEILIESPQRFWLRFWPRG
jgi:MFS family permease